MYKVSPVARSRFHLLSHHCSSVRSLRALARPPARSVVVTMLSFVMNAIASVCLVVVRITSSAGFVCDREGGRGEQYRLHCELYSFFAFCCSSTASADSVSSLPLGALTVRAAANAVGWETTYHKRCIAMRCRHNRSISAARTKLPRLI